jgi:hypothetical protein
MKILLAAAAALLVGAAPPPGETPISIKDPAAFLVQLREMGYAPDAYDPADESPTTVLHLKDETLAVVLGGCTNKRDCKYVVLLASFSDVAAPPEAFIAKMNASYDMLKVWSGDDHKLHYSMGAIVEGMPRASFRALVDEVVDSSSDLAGEVVKAGYGPKSK